MDIFVFVRVCVHVRNTVWVCMWSCVSAELCHIVYPKESGFANAEAAHQGEAIAVCLLLVGTFPEKLVWQRALMRRGKMSCVSL